MVADEDAQKLTEAFEDAEDFEGFWPLCVVFVDRGKQDRTVPIEDVGCRNGQRPTIVAVGHRKIDEGTAIKLLLLVGDTVREAELAREIVVRVNQQRED